MREAIQFRANATTSALNKSVKNITESIVHSPIETTTLIPYYAYKTHSISSETTPTTAASIYSVSSRTVLRNRTRTIPTTTVTAIYSVPLRNRTRTTTTATSTVKNIISLNTTTTNAIHSFPETHEYTASYVTTTTETSKNKVNEGEKISNQIGGIDTDDDF